jgi:hypothetical protein
MFVAEQREAGMREGEVGSARTAACNAASAPGWTRRRRPSAML